MPGSAQSSGGRRANAEGGIGDARLADTTLAPPTEALDEARGLKADKRARVEIPRNPGGFRVRPGMSQLHCAGLGDQCRLILIRPGPMSSSAIAVNKNMPCSSSAQPPCSLRLASCARWASAKAKSMLAATSAAPKHA